MPKPVYINLDELASDAKPVTEQHLFQQEAMARIKKLMLRFLKEGRDAEGPQHVHNTITINGSRGSGKTMFILTLIETLRSDVKLEEEEESLKTILPLPILDPTLIENKENIVLTILARIHKECVHKKNDCRCVTDGRDDDKEFKKVDEALRALSQGLCLLDGVGKNTYYGEDWSNPEHVVRTGMVQAYHGVVLRDQIHAFIDAALNYMGKKAFLVAFDDIDTQFQRGWPVLEVIRKYLTTPRLIVLLSGDMALYSKLVRRVQFENLGEILLNHDRPSSRFHSELTRWESDNMIQTVDRLEEQYLMKVLKPENRLSLRTLGQICQQQSDQYRIEVTGQNVDPSPTPIHDVLKRIIRNGFLDKSEASLYSEAILDLPVRTVTRFLAAARDLLAAEVSNEVRGKFAEGLTDVFASALYQHGLDPQAINRATPLGLIDQLITWFGEASVWDTGYRLKPEYADSTLNQVAMVLGARCSREANRSLADALNYMLKIVWTHEHVVDPPEKVTPDQIVSYLGLRQKEKTSTITRRSVAVQRTRALDKDAQRELLRGTLTISRVKFTDSDSALNLLYLGKNDKKFPDDCIGETNLKTMNSGIVAWWSKIYKLHRKAYKKRRDDKTPYLRYVYNTVESLSDICQSRTEYLRMAVFSVARGGSQKSYVSFFALLGAVADLAASSSDDAIFNQIANRLSQIRTYPAPDWDSGPLTVPVKMENGEDAENVEEGEEDSANSGTPESANAEASDNHKKDEFDQYVLAWMKNSNKFNGILYPVAFYGRVFTRFYYALGNMDDEFTARDTYVGTVMHRQIIAFLHAVLVEEMLENGKNRYFVSDGRTSKADKVGPRLDNAVRSDAPFWDNFPFKTSLANNGATTIDTTSFDFTGLPLFQLLFSCPIFALFVSPTSARVSGGKSADIDLLQMMVKSWNYWEESAAGDAAAKATGPDGCDNLEKRLEVRRNALSVECVFSVGNATFPNLWAPLHSLMVPGKRPLSTSIKVEDDDEPPKSVVKDDDQPPKSGVGRRGRPPKNPDGGGLPVGDDGQGLDQKQG